MTINAPVSWLCALGAAVLLNSACTEPRFEPITDVGVDNFMLQDAQPVRFATDSAISTIATTKFSALFWVDRDQYLFVVDRDSGAYIVRFDAGGFARAQRVNLTDVENIRGGDYIHQIGTVILARWTGCAGAPQQSGCVVSLNPANEVITETMLLPNDDTWGILHPLDIEFRDPTWFMLDPLYVDPAAPAGRSPGVVMGVWGPLKTTMNREVALNAVGTGIGVGPLATVGDANDTRPWVYLSSEPTIQFWRTGKQDGELLAQLAQSGAQGIAVDSKDRVFIATNDGIIVCEGTPNDAKRGRGLGTIRLPTPTGRFAGAINLAFGGPEWRTLYITSPAGLYSVTMNDPGAGKAVEPEKTPE
jgi:hypothetical protein